MAEGARRGFWIVVVFLPVLCVAGGMYLDIRIKVDRAEKSLSALREGFDEQTLEIAVAGPPTPCELAVYDLWVRCGGRIGRMGYRESITLCEAEEEPWGCLLLCEEKGADCESLPACLVRCTEQKRPPSTRATKETQPAFSGMALIPGGWSVHRYDGPRWAAHNLRFRLEFIPSFAMDIYEYPNKKGALPKAASWQKAKIQCEREEKRLCSWREWQKVCGQSIGLPFPFGPKPECERCSFAPCDSETRSGKLRESGSFPGCTGRYGVFDMAGNLSEYVEDRWGESGPHRMIAGGSYNLNWANDQVRDEDGRWWFKTYSSRCDAVHHHEPEIEHHDDGFRCCRSLERGWVRNRRK